MLKEIIFPRKELAHIVKCYWTLGASPAIAADTERKFRFLPDGCPELVFHFGVPPQQNFGGKSAISQSSQFVMGIFLRHADIQLCGPMENLLVKFHPWTLAWLLGDHATQATDRLIDVYEVFKTHESQHFLGIMEAGNPIAAIPLIEEWLLARAGTFHCDREVMEAARLLQASQGSLLIQTLEEKVNLGLRRLEQRFCEQVGVGLKYFARVVRIRAAAEAMRVQSHTRLGDIAYDHGFFDQAHFIREFRHFADMSPNAYARGIRGKASLYEMEIRTPLKNQ